MPQTSFIRIAQEVKCFSHFNSSTPTKNEVASTRMHIFGGNSAIHINLILCT